MLRSPTLLAPRLPGNAAAAQRKNRQGLAKPAARSIAFCLPKATLDADLQRALRISPTPFAAESVEEAAQITPIVQEIARLQARICAALPMLPMRVEAREWRKLAAFAAAGPHAVRMLTAAKFDWHGLLQGWMPAAERAHMASYGGASKLTAAAYALLDTLATCGRCRFANQEQQFAARALVACWSLGGHAALERCAHLLAARGALSFRLEMPVSAQPARAAGAQAAAATWLVPASSAEDEASAEPAEPVASGASDPSRPSSLVGVPAPCALRSTLAPASPNAYATHAQSVPPGPCPSSPPSPSRPAIHRSPSTASWTSGNSSPCQSPDAWILVPPAPEGAAGNDVSFLDTQLARALSRLRG